LGASQYPTGRANHERTQLLLEQAGSLLDYLSLHWYVGNWNNDFAEYMAVPQ